MSRGALFVVFGKNLGLGVASVTKWVYGEAMNNTATTTSITHTFVGGKLVNTYNDNNQVVGGPAHAAAVKAAAYRAEHGHAQPRPFG